MDGNAVKAMMAEIAPVIRGYVEASFAQVVQRLEEIEKREPAPGKKGDKGDAGERGIGVDSALVNREGALILKLSDGSMQELGEITCIQREARQAEELRAAEHRAFMAEQRELLNGLVRKVDDRLAAIDQDREEEPSNESKEAFAGMTLLKEMEGLGALVELSEPVHVQAAVSKAERPQVSVTIENHIPRKGAERTIVTEHDERGRIKSFERHEIEE